MKERFNDQRSTLDQLRDLLRLANQHGLYDAADYLTQHIEKWERRCRS